MTPFVDRWEALETNEVHPEVAFQAVQPHLSRTLRTAFPIVFNVSPDAVGLR